MASLGSKAIAEEQVFPGLPFVRTYLLNEIGTPRGPILSFDHIGRIALVSNQDYAVLNDNVWLHPLKHIPDLPELREVVWDRKHLRYLYGAIGSWGTFSVRPDGMSELHSLCPEVLPKWVRATNFEQILVLDSVVLFAGYNGIVISDLDHETQRFLEMPELSCVFILGNQVFVSSHVRGVFRLDLKDLSLTQINRSVVANRVAQLDESRVLIATTSQDLFVFDGKAFSRWPSLLRPKGKEAITSLCALPDGNVAMAISDRGLFILSGDGQLQMALTTQEYNRVFDLAVTGDGVLWLTTESMVQKVFYKGGVSVIDQRSNVIVRWPKIVEWRGRIDMASRGQLYEMVRTQDGLLQRFEPLPTQLYSGAWGMDSMHGRMLVGNRNGVYSREEDGFAPVLLGLDTARLVMTEDDYCIVIGTDAIGLLHWNGRVWRECAPRIPGVGFPSVLHYCGRSVWLELGLNLAARIWIENGALNSCVYDSFPWDKPSWINIGFVDHLVLLNGPANKRLIFDEDTAAFVEAPELERLLNSAPLPIRRIKQDSHGILWATHECGLFVMDPKRSKEWVIPPFGSFLDRFPTIELVNGDDVWLSTDSAVYHVDRNAVSNSVPVLQPMLLSVADGRCSQLLYNAGLDGSVPTIFPYSKNHLVFRFFAGNYASLQAIAYQFTIHHRLGNWSVYSTDSTLTLPNLWEGTYELTAQLLSGDAPVGIPARVKFVVEPPWFRTRAAYFAYVMAFVLFVLLVRALVVRSNLRKHLRLENLVHERTEELRATMDKLTAEVRNSATLAERNRLAGEIHDSVQQGLSGLILSLDATLKLGDLSPDVRSRLEISRRMVSFTRQEVQQAIWDLESPFLEHAELADALRSMCAQLRTNASPHIEMTVAGVPSPILPAICHHLLRIAQESITNALRHSHSDRILVSLSFSAERVLLEIQDFGKGFVRGNATPDVPGHFGLHGMQERAAKIRAEFSVLSEVNKGTTIRVSLPLKPFTDETTNTQQHD